MNIKTKILLSAMMVFLSLPICTVYGANNENLYAGATKEICELFKRDIYNIEKQEQYEIYTNTNVNVRMYPTLDSDILDVIPFNTKISVFDYSSEWYAIYWNFYSENNDVSYKYFAYINKKYTSIEECKYEEYSMPQNNGFKSFMPYTSITDNTSLQYVLQNNFAYTDEFGMRKIMDRYCVAIGTAFDMGIGTYFDLILENGSVIPCISSDIKSQDDTLQDNITTANNGCVSEFIVDTNLLYSQVKFNGDVSLCFDNWASPVKSIRIYDKNIFQ